MTPTAPTRPRPSASGSSDGPRPANPRRTWPPPARTHRPPAPPRAPSPGSARAPARVGNSPVVLVIDSMTASRACARRQLLAADVRGDELAKPLSIPAVVLAAG